MSEEKINDTTISEENTGQENTGVDVEAIQAENAKLQAILKRKNEKLEKFESLVSEKEEEPKKETITKQAPTQERDELERIELRLDGYDKETVEKIMEQGGKKFLETDLGKLAIERYLEQKNAEKATNIDSSIKSPTGKVLQPEDIKSMSSDEMEKLLPKSQ